MNTYSLTAEQQAKLATYNLTEEAYQMYHRQFDVLGYDNTHAEQINKIIFHEKHAEA